MTQADKQPLNAELNSDFATQENRDTQGNTRPDMQKIPAEVAGMFDKVAKRYDLTNDVMTFGQHRIWRRTLNRAVNAQAGEDILDIAAGTGTSSLGYYRAGAKVVACDFSPGMVAEGKKRHPELDFMVADAHNLPFEDNVFDCVTCSFGFRNMHDPQRALEEFYRVTRPGGRLVIMEFSTPTNPFLASAYHKYMEVVLPSAGKFFSSDEAAYTYLIESIINWPNQRELAWQIAQSGWTNVAWRNLTFGSVAIHRAWK